MGIIAVPNPNHEGGSAVTRSFRTGRVKHADSFSVARVRPRTSKGITDLLLLTVTRLDAACPSKKKNAGREVCVHRVNYDSRPDHESCPPQPKRPPQPRIPTTTHSTLPLRGDVKTRHLFSRLESRSLSELTRQIAPPTKNGHAPPPTESRKSSQSVNPYSVRAG